MTWKCAWAWGSPWAEVEEEAPVESLWIIFKKITWSIIPGCWAEFNIGITNLQKFLVCPNAHTYNMRWVGVFFVFAYVCVCGGVINWILSLFCNEAADTTDLKEASLTPSFCQVIPWDHLFCVCSGTLFCESGSWIIKCFHGGTFRHPESQKAQTVNLNVQIWKSVGRMFLGII